jgi:hypothetical protein
VLSHDAAEDHIATSTSDYPAEWQRALGMLAGSAEGCTALVSVAQGFSPTVFAGLVDCGLVTATTERVLTGQARSM